MTTNLAVNTAMVKPATTAKTGIDPQTGLPYVQPNQNLSLSPAVASGQAFVQPGTVQPVAAQAAPGAAPAGNLAAVAPPPQVPGAAPIGQEQVLSVAQNKAVRGPQNQTMNMTSQATQRLLRQPSDDTAALQKQQTLEKFDQERANALSALGGQVADVGHLGTTVDNLAQNYLQGASDRVQLGRQIDIDAREAERKQALEAITAGQTTAAAENDRYNTGIGALTSVIGAGEGTANRIMTETQNSLDRAHALTLQSNDIEGQKAITELKGKIDSGAMLSQQDFTASQAALERMQQTALQSGDIQAQKEIETMKASLQASLQASDQAFQTQLKTLDVQGQKELTTLKASLDSGAMVSQQNFAASQAALDRAQQNAVQKGDIAGQKEIESMKQALQLQMQAADQSFQKNLKLLDVDGQKELTTLKGNIDSGLMLSGQSFQAAQASLDRAQQTALQTGDVAAQKEITTLKASLDSQAKSAEQDFQLKLQTNDQAGQAALTELKGKIDSGMMLNEQDFKATESNLDRQLQESLASGDTAKAIKLLTMQQDFQTQAAKVQNDYDTAARIATQSWSTGERVSEQDFNKGMAYIDRETQTITNRQKIDAEMTQMTAGFTQEEKMANLQANIDQAKADGDVGRERALMSYKNDIDLEQMTAGFSQEEKMANLAAALDDAKANGDVDREKSIMSYQDAINKVNTLQEQGFVKSQAEYDALVKNQMQGKELRAQAAIEENRNNLQLTMQMNDMGQDEKMAYLGQQLTEAQAQNDQARTMQIQRLAANLDLIKINKEQGFEAAQADLMRKQDLALQQGDFKHAETLSRLQFSFQATESAKDRVLEQAKIDLEAKGLDYAKMESEYERLIAAEEAGSIKPGASLEFLQGELKGSGITLQPPDENEIRNGIDEQYDLELYQYQKTHPEMIAGIDGSQISNELVDAYKKANPSAVIPQEPVKPQTTGDVARDLQAKMMYEVHIQHFYKDWQIYNKAAANWAKENKPALLTMKPEGIKGFNDYFNTIYSANATGASNSSGTSNSSGSNVTVNLTNGGTAEMPVNQYVNRPRMR